MVVLEEKQCSCDGGAGKAIQLWWCWMGSNTVVMLVKGRQYSRGGVGGEAIQLWWCWRGSNTAVVALEGT